MLHDATDAFKRRCYRASRVQPLQNHQPSMSQTSVEVWLSEKWHTKSFVKRGLDVWLGFLLLGRLLMQFAVDNSLGRTSAPWHKPR